MPWAVDGIVSQGGRTTTNVTEGDRRYLEGYDTSYEIPQLGLNIIIIAVLVKE